MTKLRPGIKCHGGKYYLAKWIIGNFPGDYKEMTYVEPYCGGANVLLQKQQSKREIIGDLDSGVVAIYRVMRDMPKSLVSRLMKINYEEDVFNQYLENSKQAFLQGDLNYAINEIVLRRMSRGGLKKAFAWSNRQRGGQPGDRNAWHTFIKQIPALSKRLQYVEIYHEHALNLIDEFDDKNTMFYCDPTYLLNTRQSKNVYKCDMTEKDHQMLAERLGEVKGKVILSGYLSPQYDDWYARWFTKSKEIANHASQQKKKKYKTEVLWLNYKPKETK
jgi:DNA adenine methylase